MKISIHAFSKASYEELTTREENSSQKKITLGHVAKIGEILGPKKHISYSLV